MIKNYFKIAFRNFVRHKMFSLINISGLAIGVAAALLLYAVVKYELSYNKDVPAYGQVYHVVTQDKSEDGVFYNPGIPFPALKALRMDFPEITTGALLANFGSQVTVIDEHGNANPDKKFIEESGFFFSDPEFFTVFEHTWLAGSPAVLKDPNVTVLTKKTAARYFGDWKNAMGKLLLLDNRITVKVAGIIEDSRPNTDYPLSIVSSFETVKANEGVYFYSEEWGATTSNFQLFMRLPEHTSPAKVNNGLLAFSKRNYKPSQRGVRTHFLQPLSEVHYDQRMDSFSGRTTSKSTLWTLSIIGLFIIIMACINFINLSTAQAVGRSKEIGIRKVLGGYRRQLFLQVIGETLLIVCASVLVGLLLAAICLPYVTKITFIPEPLNLLTWDVAAFLAGLILLVTLLSGIYPAAVLSGFKPAAALKNKITSATMGGISIRRGLVITQFAISQVLIIGTIIAVSQMDFIRNADLGYNKQAILVIASNSDSASAMRLSTLKNKLNALNGVKSVSFCSDIPSSQNNSSTNFVYNHQPESTFNLYLKFGDEDFFNTYGLSFVAGRGFRASDTINEVVVNETLVRKLGLSNPEAIIGKDIQYGSGGDNWKKIVGVVKDFKTNTLKENIKPLAIATSRDRYYLTAVKISSTNLAHTRTEIEQQWNNVYPEYAFTSYFLEDGIAQFYEQDKQLSTLYKIFAGIAIFISCLGLYGLVTFMSVQRTKEIGIRKVLGASVQHIIYLFSKEFTLLVLVGFVIAVPAAWYLMNEWLQNFVYRINITPWVFILAMVISVLIAWLAVGYKSIKAALSNPVRSLRSE